MNATPGNDRGWRILRKASITLAIVATFIAIIYTEEDWRGRRVWENCKHELEAKGVVLEWDKFIPPPVADNQNYFKAPNMQAWFVGRGRSELSTRLQATNETVTASAAAATNLIVTVTAAGSYLAWSDQFRPDFDLISEALERPYARMDGDYSQPYDAPIPNFITVRALAQVLAQRAHCFLLLGKPDKALAELTLLNDSRHLLEGAPTGKPMTLLAAMLNVAVTGIYPDVVAEGSRLHVWQEPQLAALQNQLGHINLSPFLVQAFESEPAATTHTLETIPKSSLQKWFSTFGITSSWQKIQSLKWELIPRGWIYQNMATGARLVYEQSEGFNSARDIFQPEKFSDATHEIKGIVWPYKFIIARSIPNFTRAWQTAAHNQSMVNEAQIACALERYRLMHGEYPETLDALIPQFIQKLPHDIIGGQPLHYRRTSDGKFLLYSIGWNEKDDAGTPGTLHDPSQGDWVWKN